MKHYSAARAIRRHYPKMIISKPVGSLKNTVDAGIANNFSPLHCLRYYPCPRRSGTQSGTTPFPPRMTVPTRTSVLSPGVSPLPTLVTRPQNRSKFSHFSTLSPPMAIRSCFVTLNPSVYRIVQTICNSAGLKFGVEES
ncbi:hypothetical protein BC937DRAFT_86867 [Endogone sp. FLAS-F59071]|nr:hypothetical protein BC937DRAFT_86867 [Endogone sp. FLAS-F59071]|eukprot:RUS19809.1 hypothetical protein BC937DRAFT_86867 [Endogone sp. FLAS-F59071]